MTKSDYALVASVIKNELAITRELQDEYGYGAFDTLLNLTKVLSAKFSHEDPAFDGRLFKRACGF